MGSRVHAGNRERTAASKFVVACGCKRARMIRARIGFEPGKKTHNTMKIPVIAIVALVPLLGFLASCEKKGPAEKAGENIDEAIEDVKDAVDPKGPIEKAGEKVDEALGN